MTDTTFAIPTDNLATLNDKLAKLQKRAAKLNVNAGIDFEYVGEPYTKKVDNYTKIKVQDVRVTGEAPKLNGWRFISRIDYSEGKPFIFNAPGCETPKEYRTYGAACDHCQINRQRFDVFVVQNENTGEYQQVGRTCLKDFLGHKNPGAVASFYTLLFSAENELSDSAGMGKATPLYKARVALAFANCAIRTFGWVAASDFNAEGTPTKIHVSQAFNYADKHNGKLIRESVTDADFEKADQVLDFVRNTMGAKNLDDMNDYEYNLTAALADDSYPANLTGIVASAIRAFDRHMEKETARAFDKRNSTHFGQKGERLTFNVEILSLHTFEGNYGLTTIHKFRTADDNMVTWFSSKGSIGERGDKLTIKATIKGHNTYQGVEETVVSRVTVV